MQSLPNYLILLYILVLQCSFLKQSLLKETCVLVQFVAGDLVLKSRSSYNTWSTPHALKIFLVYKKIKNASKSVAFLYVLIFIRFLCASSDIY